MFQIPSGEHKEIKFSVSETLLVDYEYLKIIISWELNISLKRKKYEGFMHTPSIVSVFYIDF